MTPEENKRVQEILNIRTKLLNEKIAQQEEHINSLTSQLNDKEEEISALKTWLTEAQQHAASLEGQLLALKSQPQPEPQILTVAAPPQPEPPQPQKPSYLVSLLRQHFGLDSFKPGQEECVDAILSGRDVFCSMPKRYGMSICYRLPALLMPGLTIVITQAEPDTSDPQPHTEYYTSSSTPAKKREILRKLKNGTSKILCAYLDTMKGDSITKLLHSVDVSMAVIIGHENLKACSEFVDSLSGKRIARGVFTHSTSPKDRQDTFKHLRSPLKVITGWNRDVSFSVVRTQDKIAALREAVKNRQGLAGVVYCSNPETAFKLTGELSDCGGNVSVVPSVLCATVESSDVRYVIHFDPSADLAKYSREIDCALSGSSKAECILLLSREDRKNSDKSIAQFASDNDPKAFLLSYLGEDDTLTPPEPVQEEIGADFSDFDFGSANESQKEAITTTSGPVLIIAGPGTGKTYTLVQRAVFLIQKKHAAPSSIMLATFTDKAAQELRTRITEELSARRIIADTGAMYIGTFHALCARILQEYADFTEHGLGKSFRILDDFGHAYMIMQNFKLFEGITGIDGVFRNPGRWKRSQELRDYINALSEELIDSEELINDDNPDISALGLAMKTHDAMLRDNNAVSYSALLVLTYKLLRDNPDILADLQAKIQHIMIDEYQDTNYIQEQLVFLLGSSSGNICVAGDDDQSLYRFRGAAVRNILEFPDKWGKSGCKVVRLMLNYRSTPAIVRFSEEWMNDTAGFFSWENFRYPKKLEACRPSSEYPSVIRLAGINDPEAWHEKILAFLRGLKESGVIQDYSQTVFLVRSVRSQKVKALCDYLEEHNISVYSPRSNLFFKRGEIKFAIGCMIAMFPDYLSDLQSGKFSYQGRSPEHIIYYMDCLRMVLRYIDKAAYAGLKRYILTKRAHHAQLQGYTGYTYSDLLYELFAFEPFVHALEADISGSVKALRPARNFARLVQVFKDYEHSYNVNNIHAKYMAGQFAMMMNIYIKFRMEEGLDEYESEEDDIPAGHTAFMTIHQAKGKEFPIVFVDSLWSKPDSELQRDRNNSLMQEVEETHSRRPEFEPADKVSLFDFWRLYYVAFTRAQNMLVLTCNETTATPSKYLEGAYNSLDDADDVLKLSEVEPMPQKSSGRRDAYSFTRDILVYEACPMQYKFFNTLEFPSDLSQVTFMGSLVHATIEDVHRAVLNHEEHRINPQEISEWFAANYERLSHSECAYLNEASRKAALAQVMRYVNLQGNDWTGIVMAEAEASLVREGYILDGKIDLVRTRDGFTEIVDFKTGPKPNINITSDRERLENGRRQINVYAYIAAKSLGLRVSGMKLYYTGEQSSSPEIAYSYDENGAEEIMQSLDATVSRIAAKDFDHKTDNHDTCSACLFRYYCGRA